MIDVQRMMLLMVLMMMMVMMVFTLIDVQRMMVYMEREAREKRPITPDSTRPSIQTPYLEV